MRSKAVSWVLACLFVGGFVVGCGAPVDDDRVDVSVVEETPPRPEAPQDPDTFGDLVPDQPPPKQDSTEAAERLSRGGQRSREAVVTEEEDEDLWITVKDYGNAWYSYFDKQYSETKGGTVVPQDLKTVAETPLTGLYYVDLMRNARGEYVTYYGASYFFVCLEKVDPDRDLGLISLASTPDDIHIRNIEMFYVDYLSGERGAPLHLGRMVAVGEKGVMMDINATNLTIRTAPGYQHYLKPEPKEEKINMLRISGPMLGQARNRWGSVLAKRIEAWQIDPRWAQICSNRTVGVSQPTQEDEWDTDEGWW